MARNLMIPPALFCTALGAACSVSGSDDFVTRPVPAPVQRPGDASAGYHALVNNPYISCGIPFSVFSTVFGPTDPADLIDGRDGRNAGLPYFLTGFSGQSGVELVTTNCLACHAGRINGTLVIGLGNTSADFTIDIGAGALLAGGLIKDPKEKVEYQRWSDRTMTIAPYVQTLTRGVNPADNLTAALFTHRDRRTLAWSDDALLDPPPPQVIPVHVPPWWRMSKKNAMFYNASGRGDHSRIMMTASTLCTDSIAEARSIDAYFPDIRAYVASLRPPAYPFPVDAARATRGRGVFQSTCARCHGTYGQGTESGYPNLLVSLTEVGTDPTLASASQFAGRFVDWFNQSFYGEMSRIEPQPGYVAPPLDGIWATAPYLHNGSVPTLAALLDSMTRPRYWTRSFDSHDYDPAALGWRFTALPSGQAAETDHDKRIQIYDTTQPGYENGGHTYGDPLSAEDRAAVIEYLKTL